MANLGGAPRPPSPSRADSQVAHTPSSRDQVLPIINYCAASMMMTVVNKVRLLESETRRPRVRRTGARFGGYGQRPFGILLAPQPGDSCVAQSSSWPLPRWSTTCDTGCPRARVPTNQPTVQPPFQHRANALQYVVSGENFTMTFLLLAIQSAVCVLAVWSVKRAGFITCE